MLLSFLRARGSRTAVDVVDVSVDRVGTPEVNCLSGERDRKRSCCLRFRLVALLLF